MLDAEDAPASPRRVDESTPLEASAQSQAESLPSLREPVEEETLEAALSLFPAENPSRFMAPRVGWWQASTDGAPAVGSGLWPETFPVRTPAPELRAMVRENQIILERASAEAHPRVPRSVEASAEEDRKSTRLNCSHL